MLRWVKIKKKKILYKIFKKCFSIRNKNDLWVHYKKNCRNFLLVVTTKSFYAKPGDERQVKNKTYPEKALIGQKIRIVATLRTKLV